MARKKSLVANFVATMEWQTLTGDDTANIMTSTYNGTTLYGMGGDDTLTTTLAATPASDNLFAYQYGGAGLDTLTFQASGRARYIGAVLEGDGGDDTLTANVSNPIGGVVDFSNLSELYLLGGGGHDVIRAVASTYGARNIVEAYGGVGNDDIQVRGSTTYGSVSLYAEGGAGDDIIVATASAYDFRPNLMIELYGGDGNDTLVGQTQQGFNPQVYLYGGAGDDVLVSENQLFGANATPGRAELYGGEGNDVLRGTRGQDLMLGGTGADRFELSQGVRDTIYDFNLADGDRLVLQQGSVLGTAVVGGDTVVTYTGGSVLLVGVTELDLSLAFA